MPSQTLETPSDWLRGVTLDARRLARVRTSRWPEPIERHQTRPQLVTCHQTIIESPRLRRAAA
jgi:hypothetical protein